MADSLYHTLGDQQDPNDSRTQPSPQQFRSPGLSPGLSPSPGMASSSYLQQSSQGQQLLSPPYGTPQYGTPQYGGTPQLGYTPQGSPLSAQGYFPSQPSSPYHGSEGPLATQMGGMSLGQKAPASRKKKDRHAYHNLESPSGSSQAYNGIPQGPHDPTNFLNAPSPMVTGPLHPFVGQPITSAMNQFPAQVGTPASSAAFSPGLHPGTNYGGNYGLSPGLSPGFSPGMSPIMSPGMMPGMSPRLSPAISPGLHSPYPPSLGGASMTVMAGGGAGGSHGRVDPEQIPSIPRSRDVPAQWYETHEYRTVEQHLPPPGAIPFIAFDQGNSSPKFARLTLNNIPATAEALASTALPLGLVLQPLAPLQEGEPEIPVLDFGDSGPPRCRRCRSYVNPFMTFSNGGNKFVCNMCTFPNDVPPEYFAPTDPSGVRIDRGKRPELTLGTVEFMVPKAYWAKEPVGLRWLFLIDVSQEAINRGFLEAFCDGILGALYAEAEEKEGGEAEAKRSIPVGSKVGFVTFDKDIHFYNCHANLDKPQMLVMPDIEEPFVPLGSEGLFVDPYESRTPITSLLTQLPKLFSEIKNPEPALLPVMDAALSALANTGGKIVCSLSALPTWGPGRLFMRDDNKLHGIESEKKLFQTEHAGWKKTAGKMVECGVGVDLFVASPGGVYMDIATIGHISALSGGETFFFPNYSAPRDNLKVSLEIKHALSRETGYEALMKVRCSNGLQVASYHGNFHQTNSGADLEFGTIDADKAVGVLFSYDGKLDAKLDAHFQCALLYTTATGERRVRCSNTVASVSDGATECMRFVDQDAVVNIIAKEAASRMTERTLKEIRSALTEKTIDILASYRKAFSGSHPPGQLVLPENLKELSMYILGLLKCRAFKAGSEPSDRRTHTMRLLRSASPLNLSLLLYPRVIALHTLSPESGFPDPISGHLVLPPTLRASIARIDAGGAYLVDDGQTCLLWLHAAASPHLLEDLFGPEYTTLASLDPHTAALPILPTHLNAQARNLLAYWASVRGSRALTLQLARQGLDGAEYEFARLLVEDRNGEAQSYVDWLVLVHRGVQLELAGQRKRDVGAGDDGALAGLRAMGW